MTILTAPDRQETQDIEPLRNAYFSNEARSARKFFQDACAYFEAQSKAYPDPRLRNDAKRKGMRNETLLTMLREEVLDMEINMTQMAFLRASNSHYSDNEVVGHAVHLFETLCSINKHVRQIQKDTTEQFIAGAGI
jgi:hypothetical protein